MNTENSESAELEREIEKEKREYARIQLIADLEKGSYAVYLKNLEKDENFLLNNPPQTFKRADQMNWFEKIIFKIKNLFK